MWKNDCRVILRSIIFDMTEPYTYEDSKLNTLLVHAAKILCNEVPLNYNVNISTGDVSPDPSDDNNFIVLLCYKTACMIAAAEVKTYAMGSIVVRDQFSSIDMTQQGVHAQKRYENLCEQYDDLRMQYLIGNNLGKVVSGPNFFENLPYYRGNIQ